ncbi:hypothetical protein BCVP_CDS0213 [Bacillus phage BC-VP]|nr:hypothetical protein BCVP_CDS0213 [Bacillus phage BC-VP]
MRPYACCSLLMEQSGQYHCCAPVSIFSAVQPKLLASDRASVNF